MNTVAISAAVSAVVTVIVGTIINWGERITTWIGTRITPDHLPISDGGGWLSTMTVSSSDQVRVLACCAPNRTLPLREVNPDHAIQLIRRSFGAIFPEMPVFSMPEHGVQFESDDNFGGVYAWAHRSGRVDLSVMIPTSSLVDGPITFSILDVVTKIILLLDAIRSDDYARVYGRPRFRRRRFDWGIAVSQTVVVGNTGSQSWQEIRFPGAVPPRAGTQQQAFCPPGGYARLALQSWDIHRPDKDLIRVFLRDFLYQNGYHDIEQSVSNVLEAIGSIPLNTPPERQIQPAVPVT